MERQLAPADMLLWLFTGNEWEYCSEPSRSDEERDGDNGGESDLNCDDDEEHADADVSDTPDADAAAETDAAGERDVFAGFAAGCSAAIDDVTVLEEAAATTLA